MAEPAVKKSKQAALEDRFAAQIREADLSFGCYRQTLFHPQRRFRLDFAWPHRKIGVEVDGGTFMPKGGHTTGMGHEKDAEKFAEAAILGWRLIKVNAPMVRDGRGIELTRRLLREGVDGALMRLLKGYASHRPKCPWWHDHKTCDCGWTREWHQVWMPGVLDEENPMHPIPISKMISDQGVRPVCDVTAKNGEVGGS